MRGRMQDVEYENVPPPCASCNRVGHQAGNCPYVPPQMPNLADLPVGGGGTVGNQTPVAESGRERQGNKPSGEFDALYGLNEEDDGASTNISGVDGYVTDRREEKEIMSAPTPSILGARKSSSHDTPSKNKNKGKMEPTNSKSKTVNQSKPKMAHLSQPTVNITPDHIAQHIENSHQTKQTTSVPTSQPMDLSGPTSHSEITTKSSMSTSSPISPHLPPMTQLGRNVSQAPSSLDPSKHRAVTIAPDTYLPTSRVKEKACMIMEEDNYRDKSNGEDIPPDPQVVETKMMSEQEGVESSGRFEECGLMEEDNVANTAVFDCF
ncbi:OLC1v1029224C1 [Oldenlandia corymbosa var. corymbosa]|uniref:OLC1v1029224C1 n=1 Tax=Oldenlandia corymbosa var. corymbosa TaxID=529605 RepID=A0AAV1CDW9_OLDCO|nr:OLC1v1029224C1 [Oldenlandia corymbosa var. corymbosa]